MWKNENFPAAKILREISFGNSRSSKTAIFSNFRGSENDYFGRFQPPENAKIHTNQNSEPLNVLEWQILRL